MSDQVAARGTTVDQHTLPAPRVSRRLGLTILGDLFFLLVIFQHALGGWDSASFILVEIGPPAWIALALVVGVVLAHSDYRVDLPLFAAGFALGYWGEWWGTTRGVWTYWNGQTPPDYLPPLWGIGLLTVYHLHLIIGAWAELLYRRLRWPRPHRLAAIQAATFVLFPALAFAISAQRLAAVDWTGKLDVHLFAGVLVGVGLLTFRVNVGESFSIYVCGMLLGGTYEWLGTFIKEWTYVTREVPPLWIVPLWGLACVAMVKLSRLWWPLWRRVCALPPRVWNNQ